MAAPLSFTAANDSRRKSKVKSRKPKAHFGLKDNYSRFYLKYVEPSADAIDADSFAFAGLEQFPGWETDRRGAGRPSAVRAVERVAQMVEIQLRKRKSGACGTDGGGVSFRA